MNRREFCASFGIAAAGLPFQQGQMKPPGVTKHQIYDGFPVTDLTKAYGDGLTMVGRTAGSEGMRIAVTDSTGRIRDSRRLIPPEGVDGTHGIPAIARTAKGYSVSSGGWIGILAPDLTVEAKTAHSRWNGLGSTQMQAIGDGVIVAHERNAPNHTSVTVTGYDTDGNYQWHRHYGSEQSRTLGFLVSDPNGVIVGGTNLAEGGLWTAELTSDGHQQWSSTNTSVDTENDPAAVFDDGLIIFDASTLTKLDDSRSIVWERSYDSFSDRPPQLVSLSDGGMLAGTGTTIGAFAPDGRLQWVWDYDHATAGTLGELLVLQSGKYVAAGSEDAKESGWFIHLSTSVNSRAPATLSETTTDTPLATTSKPSSDTMTSMPGFGLLAAIAAFSGATAWLRHRSDS